MKIMEKLGKVYDVPGAADGIAEAVIRRAKEITENSVFSEEMEMDVPYTIEITVKVKQLKK